MIYLDHNASAPLSAAALEAMEAVARSPRGNPSSLHRHGRAAREVIEAARAEVAALLGAPDLSGVCFTSGGTESDTMALRGVFDAAGGDPMRDGLVVSAVEHPAVLETARWLERHRGVRLAVAQVDGRCRLASLPVDARVRLVSIMAANNETGAAYDVAQIVWEARAAAGPDVIVHTDAVQAAGKIAIDVAAWGVDLCSVSAHKIGGPSGIGALWVRPGTNIAPLLHGGGQERGLRSGTPNTLAIAGFGAAARAARLTLDRAARQVASLRDRLEREVLAAVPAGMGARVLAGPERRLPNTASLTFPGVKGEALVIALDAEGIAVSTGAACSSGSGKPSHVLVAMGLPREEIDGALRVSLGPETSEDDVTAGAAAIARAVNRLHALSTHV